jgi:hypothetical protein
VYHSTGLVATSYIRTLNVPCSQYIDDRHNGQLVCPSSGTWSDFERAEAAAYIVTSVLTILGYSIILTKSSLIPSQCVRFSGYLSNSLLMAFVLPDDKKQKFRILREVILSQEEVGLQMLQRFAGKTTCFSIAVPAARLYTRVIYRAIGSHQTRLGGSIPVTGELRDQIAFWRFLDTWEGHLPWFDKRHYVLKFFADASNSGWGGVLCPLGGEHSTLRDYWEPTHQPKPMVVKEALAQS